MMIDINTMISITEASSDFSKVARLVDENGAAIILENNAPRYVIMELPNTDKLKFVSDDEAARISDRLIGKHIEAYKELAK